MARRYDSADAKRRILAASAKLFLEKGYTNTKLAEILKAADVSASSFQNIFRSKDGVLTEFVGIMFGGQFGMARELTAGAPSPAHAYAVETALQLVLTEMNENLRDVLWRRTPCSLNRPLRIDNARRSKNNEEMVAYLSVCAAGHAALHRLCRGRTRTQMVLEES